KIDRRLRTLTTACYRKSLQDAEIHYGLTQSDSSAELVIDKRKATTRKSKPVMESAAHCGHFGVVVFQAISPSFTASHPDVLHPVHAMARISSCLTTSIDENN
ncbi:Hypothetical predicted protein, partial [Paramuricea clavata]